MWFHNYLASRGYTSLIKPKTLKRIGLKNKIRFVLRFKTYSFSSLNFIQESFYSNNRKILPKNLDMYFTSQCLAVWIMDDGSKSSKGMKLCTEGFMLEDLKFLQTVILKKFGLETSLNKASIYFPKKVMPSQSNQVKPYMIKSMHYKLNGY